MSRMDDYLARAEQNWNAMDLREKIAAADPDGDQELLAAFTEEHKNTSRMAYVIRETQVHEFLDDRFRDNWIYQEAVEVAAQEADLIYDTARDEGIA